MLAKLIIEYLIMKGLTISCAESCTGGMLSAALTDIPGSSACFPLGIVTYSNEAKHDFLAVPWETLNNYGAVSPETALKMAEGVREAARTDFGIAITGIAGPSGGTKEKPVGLVYIAMSGDKFSIYDKSIFQGNRNDIRQSTVERALKIIWEKINI